MGEAIMVNSEHPVKKILVTTWYRGQTKAYLVQARKEGRHYVITQNQYDEIVRKSHIIPGTTFTLG